MKILITGGTGAMGAYLVPQLTKLGYQIKILTRQNKTIKNTKPNNVEYIKGNINDISGLKTACQGVDAVIHLAGITHTNNTNLYYHINTEGTKNLIQSCEQNNVKKFLFISSRAANPQGGDYANSKFLAEQAMRASSLDWVILQPAEIYGASENEAVSKLIKQIKKNKLIPYLSGEQYHLSPIFIDDVVACLVNIFKKNIFTKKTYVLAGPDDLSYSQIIDKISGILRRRVIKIPVPLCLLKFTGEICYLLKINWLAKDQLPRLLITKPGHSESVQKDLGCKPKSLAEGIPLCNL